LQESKGAETKNIDAVDCHALVNSWTDLEPEELASIESELIYDHLLCPNVTNIEVEGSILG